MHMRVLRTIFRYVYHTVPSQLNPLMCCNIRMPLVPYPLSLTYTNRTNLDDLRCTIAYSVHLLFFCSVTPTSCDGVVALILSDGTDEEGGER